MMLRRLFFILLVCCAAISSAKNTEAVQIWDNTPVKEPQVTLLPFLTDSMPKAAVIVCPGGSYCWLDYETEGLKVAEWLQKNGIAAFVLKYRTAGWFAWALHYRVFCHGNQHPDMICDAQRAIQYVREEVYPNNKIPLGVMGFSAGGHLSMSTACFNKTNFLAPLGIDVKCDLRPDFVAPIYPVVTFAEDCMHHRSCRGLLGDKKRKQQRDLMSLEKQIPSDCPPVFLMSCMDDPIVNYYNSELLDSALVANKVEHKYIQYKTGGHGFGADSEKGTDECRAWKDEFIVWLNNILEKYGY